MVRTAEGGGVKIETIFSCGDKAFIVCGHYGDDIKEYTVGQVRVEVTNSKGIDDSMFDNYKPQTSYKEVIMCEETGIGSGSLFTAGETAFATMDEAIAGQQVIRTKYAKQIEEREAYKERKRQEDLAYHRRQLDRLEAGG